MERFNCSSDLINSVPKKNRTFAIEDALTKAWKHIHGYGPYESYKKIMVSISGGSDSDIMLDMIERVGSPDSEICYVFFDTGMEFKATKEHIAYLEKKYGIEIKQYKAALPVPLGVRKYGYPFLGKQISQYISRLQKHGFKWEDRPFEELYAEYPHCKAALRWWCNRWGENSRINISHTKYLKEFMVENPPDIPISDECCKGAKKDTAKAIEKEIKPDLCVIGVRKAEGGVRATIYSTCFDEIKTGCDRYRPILWFKKEDKLVYERAFGVTHSDCYETYGLKRTGCACCPFGKCFEQELLAAKEYEPALYAAANNVFGPSYEYTRKYMAFRERKEQEEGTEEA